MAAELELAVGDRVVYPGQGVCKVLAITEKVLAGERVDVVALAREEDGAQVLVPKSKILSVGVRKLAAKGEVELVFEYLKGASDDPELDWKVRHRAHQDKVALGGLMGLAEVVKSLQILSELRPLPAKERERYDGARHLLVREIAVALGVADVDAEDAIDLALIPLGGVKKPRAIPLADALRGGDDDLDIGGDLGSMDLGELGDEEEPEEKEEEEAAEEEASEEEAEAKPKKAAAKKAKEPKAPKEKKPKAAKPAKEPKAPKEKKPKAPAKPKPAKKK
jgi:RNA polymerase-interacting CarD/CdnL/TRCF family regulator